VGFQLSQLQVVIACFVFPGLIQAYAQIYLKCQEKYRDIGSKIYNIFQMHSYPIIYL
jgi:hypothetical protein